MYQMSTVKQTETNWLDVDWQDELKNNITSVGALEDYISLDKKEKAELLKVAEQHPMNIPRYYLELINPNDPGDPIRKLSVPSSDEMILAGAMGETTGDP